MIGAPMPRSRAIARGCAALFLLVVLLVGVPLALAHLVGWPLPSHLPSYDAMLTSVQRTGVSDRSVVKALSIVVWLTWARLAVGVLIEAIGVARSRPPMQLRSLGSAQRLAGGLVASVALLAGPGAVHGAPNPTAARAQPLSSLVTQTVSANHPTSPAAVIVQPGDTLTGLAREALGDASRCSDLWRANPGRRFGQVPSHDPTLTPPEWELRLPAPAAQATSAAPAAAAP